MVKQLVIFDMDNTLVNTKIDFQRMKKELLSLLEDIKVDHNLSVHNLALDIVSQIKLTVPSIETRAWEIIEKYECANLSEAELLTGTIEILKWLVSKKVIISIFTNNSKKQTSLLLERFHLSSFFQPELIITRDCIKNAKPDPEGILRIIDLTGITKKETLFIGDSLKSDGVTAQRAKIDFIYYNTRQVPDNPLNVTFTEIKNILDLKAFI